MYLYEKFFTVTKVHGYKIISIQRLASSLSPPSLTLPPPDISIPWDSIRKTALWAPTALPLVLWQTWWWFTQALATRLPHLPFASFWWGERDKLWEDVLLRNGQRCLRNSSKAGKDVRVISTKTSTGKMGAVGLSWWLKRNTCLGLFEFHIPTSLKGASKLYSDSRDLFLQGSMKFSTGMEKQGQVCLRGTRSNRSSVVWCRHGVTHVLGPDLDSQGPVA